MQCTVPHAMPWSFATSVTARFVGITTAATATVSRLVTRARTGSCALVSVNDRRGHSTPMQAKRRLRTKITSGTGPAASATPRGRASRMSK